MPRQSETAADAASRSAKATGGARRTFLLECDERRARLEHRTFSYASRDNGNVCIVTEGWQCLHVNLARATHGAKTTPLRVEVWRVRKVERQRRCEAEEDQPLPGPWPSSAKQRNLVTRCLSPRAVLL